MPQGVSTFVEDGYATIAVADPKQRAQVLAKILANTPAQLVQTNTRTGPHRTYTIPEGNARAAGLIDGKGKRPVGDRWDSGATAAVARAYAQEKADDHHIPTPTVAEDGYSALSSRNPWSAEAVDVDNRNQIVTGPLRPNKAVATEVAPMPPGASPTAAQLQARVKAARPSSAAQKAAEPAKAPAKKATRKAQARKASAK